MYEIDLSMTENIAQVGGSVSGQVRRAPQPDDIKDPVRGVRLSLVYWTEGRGDPDRETVSTTEILTNSDGSVNSRFELIVPEAGPISYDGRLMRVGWEVEARLDVKMRRDIKVHSPVLVVPAGGLDMYDRPHPLKFV